MAAVRFVLTLTNVGVVGYTTNLSPYQIELPVRTSDAQPVSDHDQIVFFLVMALRYVVDDRTPRTALNGFTPPFGATGRLTLDANTTDAS